MVETGNAVLRAAWATTWTRESGGTHTAERLALLINKGPYKRACVSTHYTLYSARGRARPSAHGTAHTTAPPRARAPGSRHSTASLDATLTLDEKILALGLATSRSAISRAVAFGALATLQCDSVALRRAAPLSARSRPRVAPRIDTPRARRHHTTPPHTHTHTLKRTVADTDTSRPPWPSAGQTDRE